MKNIFLFVAMLLLTTPVIAQELTGKWLINFQITEKEISEYIIYKPNKERAFGNYILINENETFSTYEAQECGSYCNIKTLGTYKMIDENYIQFILKSVLKNRFCQDKDYNPNKNIGLYYIHREEDKIRLLKSDGSIEKDRQNVIYSKMIEDFFNFQRMFPSGNKISSAKIEKMSEKDMVNTYLTNLGYTDFEYLFSKSFGYDYSEIILTKIKGEYQYLFLNFSYPKDYYLSIFNYEPIKKTDSLVDKINSDTKLKVINIDIPSNHSDIFSLLTVFYKTENNSAEKIIHQEFNKYYELTTTYYLVNETPIYIEQNYDIKSAPDRPAQNAFYIQNWNMNKYVLKKKNLGGRKFEKEKWEKIIELSNSKVSNIMGNH